MVMVMKHVYSWLAVSIITHTYILRVCVEPEAVWYRVSELYEVGMLIQTFIFPLYLCMEASIM